MVQHFETMTPDGNAVRVSIDRNIAWAAIDEGPHGNAREYGIVIPCSGSFEAYARSQTFTVRHIEREYSAWPDAEPYDSEELIQMYLTDTGIGFEWRLGSADWSKWDRVADPTPYEATGRSFTRDRIAEAID